MATRKSLSMAMTGAVFIALGTGGAAQAVVIDFETLPPDFAIVDNQFLELGVDFNGLASTATLGSFLNPSFPPFSGDTVIFDDPSLSSGTLRMDSVGSLWSMVGGYVTGNRNVTLTAFASDNSILGTSSTGGPNFVGAGTGLLPNIFLSVTAANIAYVTFQDEGNTYTIDDFTFTPISVPEPTSMLGVLAFGTFGASSLLKRKLQQKT